MMQNRYIHRAEWGASPATLGPQQWPLVLPYPRAIVHHTVTVIPDLGAPGYDDGDFYAAMRALDHEAARPDLGGRFPYSWAILAPGVVGEGQGWTHRGAHTETGNDWLGVAFVGRFDGRPLPAGMADTFRRLIFDGQQLGYVAAGVQIDPHRAYAATACPGITDDEVTAISVPYNSPTPTPEVDVQVDPPIIDHDEYRRGYVPGGAVHARSLVGSETARPRVWYTSPGAAGEDLAAGGPDTLGPFEHARYVLPGPGALVVVADLDLVLVGWEA